MELSLVLVGGYIFLEPSPLPPSFLLAVLEVPVINSSINPQVLAISMELSIFIIPDVDVSIRKEIRPLTMLHASLPLSFEAIA